MLIIGLFLFLFFIAILCSSIVWIAGKIGKLKGKEKEYRRYTISVIIYMFVIIILFFIIDEIVVRKQFEKLCKRETELKIYKNVDNVNVFLFLSMYPKLSNLTTYELTQSSYTGFVNFDYIEQYSFSNDYNLKDYETTNENGIYKIKNFIFERNVIQLPYNKIKEKKLDLYQSIKIDMNYFDKKENRFQIIRENVIPKSSYAYISGGYSDMYGIYYSKSAIIDIYDNSIIAETKGFTNYGGKFTRIFSWIVSGYSSPIIVGQCSNGLSYSEFIHKILQPPVHRKE